MEDLEFDAQFMHNFGTENPIPFGAVALCGAVSTRRGDGQTSALMTECCPICLALAISNGTCEIDG